MASKFKKGHGTGLHDSVCGMQPGLNVSYVLVTAIPTNSGTPLIPTLTSPPRGWESSAIGKIADAIHQAAMHAVAVRLGVDYPAAFIGHKRLRRNLPKVAG